MYNYSFQSHLSPQLFIVVTQLLLLLKQLFVLLLPGGVGVGVAVAVWGDGRGALGGGGVGARRLTWSGKGVNLENATLQQNSISKLTSLRDLSINKILHVKQKLN